VHYLNTSVQLLASEGECLQRGSRGGGGREDMFELPSAAFNASISIHLNIPAQGTYAECLLQCKRVGMDPLTYAAH